MALTATIFKLELQLSDLDRGYYAAHNLTIARHPSETDERLMVRIIAFALYADDALSFGRGISNTDEPALWQHHDNGSIERWIELGQPDPDRVRKACGRALQVQVIGYGGSATTLWWQKHAEKLARSKNLDVLELPQQQCRQLLPLVQRNMQLNCTIQDGELWIGDDRHNINLQPVRLLSTSDFG